MFADQTVELLPPRTTLYSRRSSKPSTNVRLHNVVAIANVAVNGSRANFNGNSIVVGDVNA
jgi:hypothetical protein